MDYVDTLGMRVDSLKPDGLGWLYLVPGWVAHLAGDTVAPWWTSACSRTTLWNEARPAAQDLLAIKEVAGNAPILVYRHGGTRL